MGACLWTVFERAGTKVKNFRISVARISHNITKQGGPKQGLSLVAYGLYVQSEFCHFLENVFSSSLEIGSVTD